MVTVGSWAVARGSCNVDNFGLKDPMTASGANIFLHTKDHSGKLWLAAAQERFS